MGWLSDIITPEPRRLFATNKALRPTGLASERAPCMASRCHKSRRPGACEHNLPACIAANVSLTSTALLSSKWIQNLQLAHDATSPNKIQNPDRLDERGAGRNDLDSSIICCPPCCPSNTPSHIQHLKPGQLGTSSTSFEALRMTAASDNAKQAGSIPAPRYRIHRFGRQRGRNPGLRGSAWLARRISKPSTGPCNYGMRIIYYTVIYIYTYRTILR